MKHADLPSSVQYRPIENAGGRTAQQVTIGNRVSAMASINRGVFSAIAAGVGVVGLAAVVVAASAVVWLPAMTALGVSGLSGLSGGLAASVIVGGFSTGAGLWRLPATYQGMREFASDANYYFQDAFYRLNHQNPNPRISTEAPRMKMANKGRSPPAQNGSGLASGP